MTQTIQTIGRCHRMKKYEVMIIVNASLDEEQVSALETRLFAPILENGGSIDKVDDWEFANSPTRSIT